MATATCKPMSNREVVAKDLDAMNAQIVEAGALMTTDDGFQWVDESKLHSDFVRAYRGLCRYAYATGAV